MYAQVDELRDLPRRRLRHKTESQGVAGLDTWQAMSMVLAEDMVAEERGERFRSASSAQVQNLRERLGFAPSAPMTPNCASTMSTPAR